MFKIIALFIIKFFARYYVRVDILLTFGKHLHDSIISQRGEVWVHKTNLISPLLFIYVSIPSQKVNGHVFVCSGVDCILLQFKCPVRHNQQLCMYVCVSFFLNLITYLYEGHMRGLLLTRKQPDQVFLAAKLKSSFRKSYDDLVDRYVIIFVSQMTRDMFHCRNHLPVLSSFVAYRQVCNKSNTTGVTCEARNCWRSFLVFIGFVLPYLSCWCNILQIIVSPFWPLYCLSFLAIVLSILFRFMASD